MKHEPPNGWNLIEKGEDGFAVQRRYHGVVLRLIASWGCGWDHVSVSIPNRCPDWNEMSFVKEELFGPDETVMQLHVPRSDWINCRPYCLHLWRPQQQEIPRPTSWMVGPNVAIASRPA